MKEFDSGKLVFIVGSPRSGTTVFGDILNSHESIRQWYEPYFILDRHFRLARDDGRSAADAVPIIIRQIQTDFQRYRKKTGADIVVDKSPRNSLKISFLRAIFPQAKFIHLLRDGRDATLSIYREWNRRRDIIQGIDRKGQFDYIQAIQTIRQWLARQPLVSDRLRAFWFETHGQIWNKKNHLNRLRWNGDVGWGPRFPGWEKAYAHSSQLQFNAMQWVECVETILLQWEKIPENQKIEIRYEELIANRRESVEKVLSFIGVPVRKGFFDKTPKLDKNNINKWLCSFSREEKMEIAPLLSPTLRKTGYVSGDDWNGQLPVMAPQRCDK